MTETTVRNGNKETARSADEIASARAVPIDHEARAQQRVAEMRAIHGDGDFNDTYVDKWYAAAPPGWVYEWKTYAVWNKEYPQYVSGLQRTGWSAVQASRHRDLVYAGYEGENIIIDGMILMERPKELVDRVRQQQHRLAIDVVRNSERRLAEAPSGTAPRTAFADTAPRVRSHVGPGYDQRLAMGIGRPVDSDSGSRTDEREKHIRNVGMLLIAQIVECVPKGREQSIALTKVDEAVMWAVKGLTA